MKLWAVYKITCHGMPVYPEFLFRYKHRAEHYLEDSNPQKGYEKYIIRQINTKIPKYGLSLNDYNALKTLKSMKVDSAYLIVKTEKGVVVRNRIKSKEAVKILKQMVGGDTQ